MKGIRYHLGVIKNMQRIYLSDNMSVENSATHTHTHTRQQNHKIGILGAIKSAYCLLDSGWAYIVHGASFADYYRNNFYQQNYFGRREWLTYRRFNKMQKRLNNSKDVALCQDKRLFNQHFKDCLGREYLDLNVVDYQKFHDFIQDKKTVFLKEVDNACGRGVQKLNASELSEEQITALWTEIKNSKATYLLEEKIEQHHELSAFHPYSVNTIRMITVFDDKADEVHIIAALLRMGNYKCNVDNACHGGMYAYIDIETGVMFTKAYDLENREYIFHPETGKLILGFQVPYWEQCKQYVKAAAKRLPAVRYVGWDVVIKEDGTISFIEANHDANRFVQQYPLHGLWCSYKALIKKIK